jgi:c-di-GMP-binding flagellar brake protein YcgR
MPGPKQERRSGKRVDAQVPATVATLDGAQKQAAVTRDLSMTGIFLYADQAIALGSKIEVVLMLPAELGLGEKQWACCQASVVRLEDDAKGRMGVGARIDHIDVLPEILA